jgi:hypothetical protein
MRAPVRIAVIAAAAAALAGGGSGMAASPLYIPPSQTKVCGTLPFCFGITGPWIVVPARGEATFLLRCPVRSSERDAFLIGGADALASSSRIRVWYDGNLTTPIGSQMSTSGGLLFHAVSRTGDAGTFQPIVGCINLRQVAKRSTVSARHATAPPGTPHSAPAARPRAKIVILAPGSGQSATVSCLPSESLAGSWKAYGFGTVGPPAVPAPGAVRIVTHEKRGRVVARIDTDASVPHLIFIQIGAICEP